MTTEKAASAKKINCMLPGAELLEQGKSVGEVMAELEKGKTGKHAGGRPRKFTSPDAMQAAIDDYFESCFQIVEIKKGSGESQTITTERKQCRPFTIMGLALALDMCRKTLCEYEKNGEFCYIVKKAKSMVEASWEERLASCNATGAIFWLKNHAGYVDKQLNEHFGKDGSPIQFNFTLHPDANKIKSS